MSAEIVSALDRAIDMLGDHIDASVSVDQVATLTALRDSIKAVPEWLVEMCMVTESVTPTTDIRATVEALIDWHCHAHSAPVEASLKGEAVGSAGQLKRLVQEGLEYFDKAGDAGDKRYVSAIRSFIDIILSGDVVYCRDCSGDSCQKCEGTGWVDRDGGLIIGSVSPQMRDGSAMSHIAAPQPAVSGDTRKAVLTAPERIYLQISDDAEHWDEEFPSDTDGVTWCGDKVLDCEIEYMRADLAAAEKFNEVSARVGFPDRIELS